MTNNRESKENKTVQLDQTGTKTLTAILGSKTMTEAAEKLSIGRNTLYQRIEKYNLREILDEIPRQALDTLKMASVDAANVYVKNLDNRQKDMEAATQILDRVGVGVKKEATTTVPVQINNFINKEKEEFGI